MTKIDPILHIEMLDTCEERILSLHQQRREVIKGIENMLACEGFRSDWHFLSLLKDKTMNVYKNYVREIVDKRSRENAPSKEAMRGMDSTWTDM